MLQWGGGVRDATGALGVPQPRHQEASLSGETFQGARVRRMTQNWAGMGSGRLFQMEGVPRTRVRGERMTHPRQWGEGAVEAEKPHGTPVSGPLRTQNNPT